MRQGRLKLFDTVLGDNGPIDFKMLKILET